MVLMVETDPDDAVSSSGERTPDRVNLRDDDGLAQRAMFEDLIGARVDVDGRSFAVAGGPSA